MKQCYQLLNRPLIKNNSMANMVTINSIFFFMLLVMSSVILSNLIQSKNGILRKRLILYFSAECWLLIMLLLYECFYGDNIRIETQIVFLIAFTPKVVAKIRLFTYLNKK